MDAAFWRPMVPNGTLVPVVIDAGPCYGGVIDLPTARDAQFILPTLVKHGIAYAHVAVRGSSTSGGCEAFFSPAEQKDVDTAVTYFGNRTWSNGNVGMMGISYDGSTPWVAAAFGNPHLKTIVPEEGITSVYDLLVRNGTPTLVAAYIQPIYWTFGFGSQAGGTGVVPYTQDRAPADLAANLACPDAYAGTATTADALTLGDYQPPGPLSTYWSDRNFQDRVLKNYHGSVFVVEGLQDWRVPATMDFPFVNELRANGNDVKVLLGQWFHDLADSASRGADIRWDYAETLLHWFDKYLRGNATVDTGPAVAVEDDHGSWRNETQWPPADTNWTTFRLGDGVLSPGEPAAGSVVLAASASAPDIVPAVQGLTSGLPGGLEYDAYLTRIPHDLRFAGLAQLQVTFVPTTPAGNRIYAELVDVGRYGQSTIIAHAVMDLRFAAGGHTSTMVTPGQPVVAHMEFYPADVVIPAGHTLELRIENGPGYSGARAPYGPVDNFFPDNPPAPVTLEWGGNASVLRLPTIPAEIGSGRYPGEP
ncbi:MAG: CocE/NonD family hydrolase [Thermoplasmatota archaeon]